LDCYVPFADGTSALKPWAARESGPFPQERPWLSWVSKCFSSQHAIPTEARLAAIVHGAVRIFNGRPRLSRQNPYVCSFVLRDSKDAALILPSATAYGFYFRLRCCRSRISPRFFCGLDQSSSRARLQAVFYAQTEIKAYDLPRLFTLMFWSPVDSTVMFSSPPPIMADVQASLFFRF